MRVIPPVCRLLFFDKHSHRYSGVAPLWGLPRPGIVPLALSGLMAITAALCSLGANAGGGGNRVNGTAVISSAAVTTMIAQLSLGTTTQNHTSQTTPITRQPTRHSHTKHPVPLSLTRTHPKASSRSRPRPTPVGPISNSGKPRGKHHQSITCRGKGRYPTRDVKIHDTVSPSIVAYTTDKAIARYGAGKSKKRHTRNGKRSERSNHSLHSYRREDSWELSSTLISQTEETPVLTTASVVEPTPSAFTESKPTVFSSLEPTPSLPQTSTVSRSPEPTPSLLEPTSAPVTEQGKPTPKPTCPPRAERPTLKFIRGDNQGNIYVKLENTPEFIEACQPLVYRLRSRSRSLWYDREYQTIATNLTANNTEFQTSTNRHNDHVLIEVTRDQLQVSHGTGDQQAYYRNTRDGAVFNIYFNAMTACRNNPSLNRRTGWFITQSYDPNIDQGKLVAEDTDQKLWSLSPIVFEIWYNLNGSYQNLTCTDKYGKMQLESIGRLTPAGQCPVTVTTGKFVYARIFASFNNGDCFSSPVEDGLQLNGQSAHGIVRRWGPFRGYIKFALNCQRLQSYDIWKDGALNFTLSRPTTRPGGEPDKAGITIPIQKRPDITGVQLNHDNRRLTIQFRDEPSWCLAVVVTTAPFPVFAQQVNGATNSTANNTEPSSTDWGQVFLCLNPDRVLSIPLGDSRPEQSDVVLISLLPVWDIEEDFSPENPRDRNLVQGAEHLVAYPGQQPPWDDNNPERESPEPDARFTIKPCTGHCQTHLLPTMLANIGNVTSGPCPWIPDPVTTQPTMPAAPTPPNDSKNIAWLLACSGAAVLAPCAIIACGAGGCLVYKARQKTSPPSDPPTDVEPEESTQQATSKL